MWCVVERKQGNMTRIIGPFDTAQIAAKWVDESYTPPLGIATTIEKMVAPKDAAKPNG
jgi:hypothetical protein